MWISAKSNPRCPRQFELPFGVAQTFGLRVKSQREWASLLPTHVDVLQLDGSRGGFGRDHGHNLRDRCAGAGIELREEPGRLEFIVR